MKTLVVSVSCQDSSRPARRYRNRVVSSLRNVSGLNSAASDRLGQAVDKGAGGIVAASPRVSDVIRTPPAGRFAGRPAAGTRKCERPCLVPIHTLPSASGQNE